MSDALSVVASVIAIVDATVKILKYLNDVKDAPQQRADCERDLATLYSLLISLKYRLDVSDLSKAWNQAVRTLGIENGPFAQYAAVLEELHRKIANNNKIVAALKWKFTKEDVKELRSKIEGLKSTIQIVLELDQFELSKATKDDTEAIKEDAAVIKTSAFRIHSSILQHEYTQKLQDAFDWISDTNYPARQSDFLSRRQPGTGAWFLNLSEFIRWQKEPRSTLLCVGMPGAGKTMLAAIAIEHLGLKTDLEKAGVAYVFCNYKDQTGDGRMDPLAAMLKQLVQNKPSSAAPLLELHSLHHKHNTRPSEEDITKTLQQVLKAYTSAYVVLDALDEYPAKDRKRDRLLARIFELQRCSDLQLVITSRPIPEVIDSFGGTPKVEVRASHADIRLFAAERTGNLPKSAKRDAKFVDWVLNTVVGAVDGMFLLAQFYMDRLAETSNKRQIKMLLGSLPRSREDNSDSRTTYNEVYEDSVGRIETQAFLRRDLAKRTLSWVTLARRPLTVEELRHALAVETGDQDLDEDNISDIEEIISACAGLITVEKSTDLVRFMHYTTQEFFDTTIHSWYPEAQAYAASTCLAFLRFEKMKSMHLTQSNSPIKEKAMFEAVPFLVYAVLHWADHVKPCQEALLEDVIEFLHDDKVRQNMIIAARSYRVCKHKLSSHIMAPREIDCIAHCCCF
ncbi:hypothetical protein P154DRAFT_470891 [Amniculicola lignicola CBS 123094]|uniref:NACHT domain-containing protein n=1 Tax=Amniculicola lignicola CBS 123094 TaxID=1392246 RepID=A0A6A5W991_9PLEO|nr:hypothetical protein P154DRAFT_470891 [Amniculicola lignicola CBS 123094]